jgi:hypothetical protein
MYFQLSGIFYVLIQSWTKYCQTLFPSVKRYQFKKELFFIVPSANKEYDLKIIGNTK